MAVLIRRWPDEDTGLVDKLNAYHHLAAETPWIGYGYVVEDQMYDGVGFRHIPRLIKRFNCDRFHADSRMLPVQNLPVLS